MRYFYKYIVNAFLIFVLVSGVISQELTREEKRNLKKEVRKLLKECTAQYNLEDYALVQTLADSILSLEQNNSDAYYFRSLSYLKRGDTTNTIESLKQGVEISPLASRLKIFLSRIFLAQNNLEEAESLIDGVLAIKPSLPEGLYLKGLVFLSKSDSTQAVVLFKKSLENQIFKD
jgi:tetratricopeptide (TPR) repeat protein